MNLHQSLVTTRKHHLREKRIAPRPHESVRRHLHRPLFESLEARLVPTTMIDWINPAGGDWDTGANWQGGVVPGAGDEAVINEPGNVTITHSMNIANSVASISASDPITLSGGTLTVTGTFSDSSPVTLSGGTLAGATVQAGTTLSGSGTLSGITLDGTLDVNDGTVTVTNGLTLGSALIEISNISSLDFSGTQSLTGTGEVLFAGGNNPNNQMNLQGSGSVLTIGSGITIDGLTGTLSAGSGTVENSGTISVGSSVDMPTPASAYTGGTFILNGAWTNEPGATMQAVNDGNLVLNSMGANDGGNTIPSGVFTNDAGATLSVTGNSNGGGGLSLEGNGWSNAGTITMSNSSVYLGGTFSLAALGTFSRSAGTVNLTGTVNNTGTLALNNTTGPWSLDGGTIDGGTVTTAGTNVLQGFGTLSGVTLDGTLMANTGDAVTIKNGLILESALVEITDISSLAFSGTQSLSGTGEVLFDGGNNPNNALSVQGSATLTIDSGITIDGLTATISADGAGGTIDNYGTLSVGTSVDMPTPASAYTGGTFILNGAWTNEPGATMRAVNDGNLVLNSMGANDAGNVIPNGVFTNDAGATLSVTGNSDGGGGLSLEGNGWSNAGTITMSNSSVYLGGTFTLAALGTVSRSAGTVNLTGTLNNTGTLALNSTTGPWNLDGGTIDGGTVTTAGTNVLQGFGTLSGVTLDGTLMANTGDAVTIKNGLILESALVEITDISSLAFSGTQSLSGTGEVLFDGGNNPNNDLSVQGSATLTIDSGITIDGLTATISADGAGGAIDNYGTLNVGTSVDMPTPASAYTGGTFILNGAWTNEPGATMQAVNDGNLVLNTMGANDAGNVIPNGVFTNDAGATLSVTGNSDGGGGLSLEGDGWSNAATISMTNSSVYLGGTFTLAALGNFSRSGGTVYLNGTLNNTGTLALNNTTGPWELDDGTIDGGTVTTIPTAELSDVYESENALIGVTLAGTLNLSGGDFTSMTVSSGLTLSGGQVNISSGESVYFSGTQTLGGTGEVLFLGNDGLDVLADATLTIQPGVTIGSADGGSVSLIGSFNSLGTLNDPAGYFYLKGTLNNSNSTLALNNSTALYLESGTISGGTVTTAGGDELVGTMLGGTLAGVTLAGTLEMASPLLPTSDAGQVTVTDGLTLSSGSIEFSESAVLTFQGTQSLSGDGTLTLANVTGDGGLGVSGGSTLTIGSGVVVQGSSGTVGSSSAGLITNEGTIEATGGGTLTVQGYTNFAAGTLTGGTWGAVGGSSLVLVGATITTSAAGILLDGASSQIDSGSTGTTSALAGFVTNAAAGTFTIQNGADFTAGAAFTNAGTLTINSGGAFAVGGTGQFTQTAGTTILNAGTLGTAGNQIDIEGGTLSGPGTVEGNLSNAGEVDLGTNPGTLTVSGNYTQTSTGILTIKVGGATAGSLYDQVNVTGTAALDGTLDVSLINGFAPELEESFDVLNFASSSGSFATFNSPTIGGLAAFITNSPPTSVDLVGSTSAPNLAVSNITFTPAQVFLNQTVAVTFIVTNLGTVSTTVASWTDSVYLSIDATIDPNAVLLGRIAHSGDLAAFSQYTATLTAPVPAITPGSYHVIVVTDSGLQVPDINRANGTNVATTEVAIQPPNLVAGTPLSGTIANAQDLYYRLNVTPGTSVKLAATFATADESEMSVLLGALPADANMGLSSGNLNDLNPELQLPTGQGGAYYIWLHGLAGAGAGQSFTLLAILDTFEVDSFSESSASNTGPLTMGVTGAGFTPQTAVALKDGSTIVAAQTTTFISTNDLTVTFDLTDEPVGSYSVEAVDAGQTVTAPGTFQITAQAVSDLQWFETATPSNLSPGQAEFLGAGVTNDGTTDAQVPAFSVVVSGLFSGDPLAAGPFPPAPLETDFVYPGGTLAPGQSITATYGGEVGYSNGGITLGGVSPDSSLALEADQPFGVPAAAWAAIVNNFIANVGGETVSDEETAFQTDAIYLAQVGDSVTDQDTLFGFELLKAEDALPSAILTSVVDSQTTEPGLALTFARSFDSSLIGRYTLGELGYGWTSNWDISATTDPAGNVYIQDGSITREFQYLGNGQYLGADGDQGLLTLTQGSYTLRDTDGTVTTFLPDGQLNYVQDSNGNRVTAGYTGTLMTSLTASDGDRLLIGYNAQGVISQITDPAGNVTTYAYDSDEQLTSVSNASGTEQYSYINGQGAAQEHALSVITNPDGAHTYFVYDSEGRLIEQSGDNGAGAVTYAYLSPGGYTVTDATGATTTVLYDVNGLPAVVKDPLGNVSQVTYNADGQPVLTSYPGGTASSTTYDSNGNITSQTDPLGNVTQYTTNASGQLESLEDPDGNTTSFSYTTQGNLASITQPDGTAASYVYNSQSEVSESIDALGRVTHYTYDSHGQMVLRQNPDGTSIAYGYDASGNLTSVTDASGTITMSYDAANNLTKIVYPNGQFLAYTYNAGGQLTQMIDQTGFTQNYSYLPDGQLGEVTDGSGNLIVSYTYDLDGRLVAQINGNGTYTTYTYTPDGQISDLSNFAPHGTVNSSFVYTYNALGLVTSMTTLAGKTTYGYDADGQLTSAELPTAELITYAYDAAGNRTVVSDSGATTTYTTNNLNQYTSVGASTYSYDANGNLVVTTRPGGDTTYTYDDESRLIAETTPTDTYTFQYNALGNLISSTDNGETTQYLINPLGDGSVDAEFNGAGSLIANFTYGAGLVSQVTASGAAEYYDYDALGSTVGLSGSSGSYLASYAYLPFGAIQSTTGNASNPFQYVGKMGVMALGGGLDFNRNRFYSPAIGRFISRDPLGIRGGTNLYAYAANDPINLIDPIGLDPGLGFDPTDFVDDPTGPAVLPQDVLGEFYAGLLPDAVGGVLADGVLAGAVGADIPAAADGFLSAVNPETGGSWYDTLLFMQDSAAGVVVGIQNSPVGAFVLGAAGLTSVKTLGSGALSVSKSVQFWAVLGAAARLILSSGLLGELSSSLASGSSGLQNSTVVPGKADFTVHQGKPSDPNYISGPGGFGAQAFVADGYSLPYVIGFENDATATAPAQSVTVSQQLDTNLDWSTFQLGDFGFGGMLYQVPAGLTSYSTLIDAISTVGVYVEMDADFDQLTGVLTWNFTSIDPTTLDQPVGDLQEGFLPPDVTYPEGDGYVTYTIEPKATDTTGTVINAQATVYFNPSLVNGSSLETQSFLNTIDTGPPTSSVGALPPEETSTSFTVTWSGQDDPGGSGIASYDIYVSDDGAPYSLWESDTTAISATFAGKVGDTYRFYSVATDNVGNVEATPTSAQATTTVVNPTSLSDVSGSGTYGGSATLTATLSSGGSPLAGESVAFTLDVGGSLINEGPVITNSNGVAMLSGISLAGLGAGTLSGAVTASFAGDATDASTGAGGDLTITRALLTITAANASMVAGQPVPAFSANYNGFVLGQGPGVLDGRLTITTPATMASPAGSYPIVAGGLSSPDYAITYVDGTLTVSPLPVTPTKTVIISEAPLFRRKLNKKGKPTGKPSLSDFTLDFSAPLNPATAGNPANYQIDSVTKKKSKKGGETILHPITNFTVSYVPAQGAVEIAFGAKETFPTGGQLTVLSGITTASGGTLTGNAVFTISKGGKSISPSS